MLRFFHNRLMQIGVNAVGYVNFNKIDARIKHDGNWLESYPAQATISVPDKHAAEIIAKLKLHDEITNVNGEMIKRGAAVQAELRKKFEAVRPRK